MRETLKDLYDGDGTRGRVFRAALMAFDVATIAYFLYTAGARLDARILAIDLAVGAVVAADLLARASIAQNRLRFLVALPTLADLVVLASLVVPLIAGTNLGFLRVLRVVRLVRTFRLAEELDRVLASMSVNTRVSSAALNLGAFILVVTSLVWVVEHDRNDDLNTFIDALYFTLTTLTTTGFGDITLQDRWGRILTIGIMVFGVGFFLQLLQALWRPDKVEVTCDTCGLSAHDRDAVHCKHCGTAIYIETEGET